MATAPKGNPKVVPLEEVATAAPPPGKSKKKLFLMLGAVLLAIGGGGGAWYFMSESQEGAAPAKQEPIKPPVFVAMDPFTVNLQPEAVEQYLQVQFTVQVADEKQVELLKLYMPLVRSRLLLLLSSKKPSELTTPDGKKKLQDEIVTAIKQPFTPQSQPLGINGVFFTSFVIQ